MDHDGGKAAIAAAAKQLRHRAVQDSYRGHTYPEHAFGLASVLDVLEVGFRDLPADVAAGVVDRVRDSSADGDGREDVEHERRHQ